MATPLWYSQGLGRSRVRLGVGVGVGRVGLVAAVFRMSPSREQYSDAVLSLVGGVRLVGSAVFESIDLGWLIRLCLSRSS